MKKFSPTLLSLAIAAAAQVGGAQAYEYNMIQYYGDSSNFGEQKLDTMFKVNFYNLRGDTDATNHVPAPLSPAVDSLLIGAQTQMTAAQVAQQMGVQPQDLPPEVLAQISQGVNDQFAQLPPRDYDVRIHNETQIEELGSSLWLNYQSGWMNLGAVDFGFEIGAQGGFPNLHQDGYAHPRAGFDMYVSPDVDPARSPIMSTDMIDLGRAEFGYYFEEDDRDHIVGKWGNVNLRLRVGDDDNNAQLIVGRFTPSMYNLLHRPEALYRAFQEVYEGAAVMGHFEWDWGMAMPWFNYFTGFSDQNRQETVHFDDLDDNYGYGSFDEIYNLGWHTITDYFTSSASFSVAPDFQSNGIIEVYSGIPLSWLGHGTSQQDKTHFIKYMLKYGYEEGMGALNDDHSTDVFEYGLGVQYGNFEFLAGQTFIGDETFRGFSIQDAVDPTKKAGGGVAIWPDMAVLNSFFYAGQKTTYLVGSYMLDDWGLEGYKLSGVIASARDTDMEQFYMEHLANPETMALGRILGSTNGEYTETNFDLSYNYFEGAGFGWRFMAGMDTNMGLSGFGLFFNYKGDVLEALGQ